MSVLTASQTDYVPPAGATAPPTSPTESEALVRAQAALDQERAKQRESLVNVGRAIFGAGLTRGRMQWCKDVISYAVASTSKLGAQERIIKTIYSDCIQDKDALVGKSKDSTREFNEMFKLYCLFAEVPLVQHCDSWTAQCLMRFVGKWNYVGKADIKNLDDVRKIVTDLIEQGKYRSEKGSGVDRKSLKQAIDDVLGGRASPSDSVGSGEGEGEGEAEAEGSTETQKPLTVQDVLAWLQTASTEDRLKVASQVVNIDVVAAFLTAATADDLLAVGSKLSEKRQVELCDALTPVNV